MNKAFEDTALYITRPYFTSSNTIVMSEHDLVSIKYNSVADLILTTWFERLSNRLRLWIE